MKFSGNARTHWTYKKGDDTVHVHGYKEYIAQRFTAWGNFYKTAELDGAGENAYFGGTPGDGAMSIPLNQPIGSFLVAVRVMDYDWGKKDDLLGEVLIDPAQLLQSPGTKMSFPLTRKGKPEKSEVTLSATLEAFTQLSQTNVEGTLTSGTQLLKLVCHQATNLRSGDWFSKNDVYVQAYTMAADTDASSELPPPNKKLELPAAKYVLPFEFTIPSNGVLPPSCEMSGWFRNTAYIRYSLYAHIDIAWKLDPSTRQVITVLSAAMPPKELLAPAQEIFPEEKVYGCDCCCFQRCEKGTASMSVMVDRRVYSPGDSFYLAAQAHNGTDTDVTLKVFLTAHVHKQGHGDGHKHKWETREYMLHEVPVTTQSTLNYPVSSPTAISVPMIPPTYADGDCGDWSLFKRRYNPLTWWYTLTVKLDQPGMFASDIVWTVPVYVGAMPVPVMQQIYPALVYEAPPAPLVIAPVSVEQKEPLIVTTTVCATGHDTLNALQMQPSPDTTSTVHEKEDANNFGGPPADYAPVYVVPAQQTPILYPMPALPPPGAGAQVVPALDGAAPAAQEVQRL